MNEPVRLFLKLAMWLIGLIAFLILFVVPVASAWIISSTDSPSPELLGRLKSIEFLQVYSLRFLMGTWFFVLGSCFASFLNVVAWRVPRGRTILGSSHCPKCTTRLAFTDNFPVIGWLKNGGKCRTCRLPISPRYLIVEIVLGLTVLGIVLASMISGGITFPIREPNSVSGFEAILYGGQYDLFHIVGGHIVLLLFVFTFALVELENARLPKSIFFFGISFGITMPVLLPGMQVMSWNWPVVYEWPIVQYSPNQYLTILIGGIVGFVVGFLLSKVLKVDEGLDLTQIVPGNPLVPENVLASKEEISANNEEDETEFAMSDIDSDVTTIDISMVDIDTADMTTVDMSTIEFHSADTIEEDPSEPYVVDAIEKSSETWGGSISVENPAPAAEVVSEPGVNSVGFTSFTFGLALVGLFLGWQSVLVVGIATMLLSIAMKPHSHRMFVTSHGLVFVVTIVHLLTWRWMNLLG